MASVGVDLRQSVVSRVISLPLVSSTYGMVSSAYINTKENHPYLRSLCEVAEKGVMTFTAVAMTSAKPIIQRMEPQIVVANNFACIGLDKIEKKLPILHQPSDQVVSRASDIVAGAKDALNITVTSAKDTMAQTINEAVVKTKEAVHERMERTKAIVNDSIDTVLRSHLVQIVNHGVDNALAKSETLVDQYFPLTEEEQAKAADAIYGVEDEARKPNCCARLKYLSTKVRKCAYQRAITQVTNAKYKSQEAITQLHHAVDLMQYAKKNMDSATQKLHDAQEKLYQSLLEWNKSDEDDRIEEVESRTLTVAHNLTKCLQTTCLTLLSGVRCLPLTFQEQAYHVSSIAGDLYQNFNLVSSFREVSDSLLATTKEQLDKMKESLDYMMDYIVNHTPLNWLVPDFAIRDFASDSDMDDVYDFDDDYALYYVHTNGHINPLRAE